MFEAEGGRGAMVARRHGLSESLLYNWRSVSKAFAPFFLAWRPVYLRMGLTVGQPRQQQIVGADPFSGHLFLFRGKRGNLVT